jgi:hypothetical protein
MSDDNREAAIKAVRHELNEVEALTEYSERGACEICEAVVRVVLEAMTARASMPPTDGEQMTVRAWLQREGQPQREMTGGFRVAADGRVSFPFALNGEQAVLTVDATWSYYALLREVAVWMQEAAEMVHRRDAHGKSFDRCGSLFCREVWARHLRVEQVLRDAQAGATAP